MLSHAIDTFVTIVRTGSLSAAAAEMNLTQTTISKRIKALEEELGMQLLERGKGIRQVKLTASGEEFSRIAERWSLLSREVNILSSQGPRLSLTIGSVDSLNVFVFPRLYRALHEEHPSLKMDIVTLHSYEMYDMIERRQLDLAFTLRERSMPNVNVEVFFSSPMVVLSLQSGRAGSGRKVRPQALSADHELFVPWGRQFDAWHDRWWDPLTPSRIKLDSGHLILSMLHHPRQWSIVPLWLAQAAASKGPFMYRELTDAAPPYTCYKLTHKQPTVSTGRSLEIVARHCTELFDGDAVKPYLGWDRGG
ncbi:LysR family transcriptional regulator [Herbaspirillum sp. LeCh32-8]|uniref:LysR family transcriptional regulator n=1 Tax=Herbaspirillum sp. LeCh32-8 TaxID=2821356 RepID=UPI001AE4EBCC|nr:LysR family transcriptional regulator [Herbaspirillum sp. LeCh32-8]MBP0598021.1 LysR family transcriptional regulator [Herbaspirillum sp. LeCh32-8]